MAGAHVLAEVEVVGKGQHAACGFDAAIFDDGRSIVEGGALVEDGAQHLKVDRTVHGRAGADDLREVGVPFQHDEGAGLGLRKALGGIADGDDGAAPRALEAGVVVAALVEKAVGPLVGLAHPFQRTPYLRLEQHHQRQQTDLQQRVQQPSNGAHIQDVGHQIDRHHDERALGQLAGPGAVDDAQKLVDEERDDEDVQQVYQLEGLKVCYDRVQSHGSHSPVHTASMRATAWAAMPSPSPVKPRCSSVVALTLTASTCSPKAAASFSRMTGI